MSHGRSRSAGSVIALCAALVIVAGCDDASTTAVRPYPEGNPVAASRPLSPSAAVVVPTARRPLVPGHLVIPAISVNARVVGLGTTVAPDPFLGGKQVTSFEVPADLSTVGWWRDGARLGDRGMAVLLGHSQVGGGYAVFNDLSRLAASDSIIVETADGRERAQLRVTRVVAGIPKDDEAALQTALSSNAQTSDLALITCSGPFDISSSESEENTAVFARLS
ncbi:class F sortase [Williamsia sp. SKLECPSW1]